EVRPVQARDPVFDGGAGVSGAPLGRGGARGGGDCGVEGAAERGAGAKRATGGGSDSAAGAARGEAASRSGVASGGSREPIPGGVSPVCGGVCAAGAPIGAVFGRLTVGGRGEPEADFGFGDAPGDAIFDGGGGVPRQRGFWAASAAADIGAGSARR